MTGPVSLDPRAPRPDPRFDLYGALVAACTAAFVYAVALSIQTLPARNFSIGLFAAAPILGAIALLALHVRARDDSDASLQWVSSGLAVAVVSMTLQFIAFPTVARGGGIFGTSGTGSAALYLLFHIALALGVLLGASGTSPALRRPFVAIGLVLAVMCATDVLPLPRLLDSSQSFTPMLRGLEYAAAALLALVTGLWVLRVGRSARSLAGWVGVALSCATYETLFNAVSARRYNAIWWSSLSMRVATFAVLCVGVVGSVLRELTA